MAKIIDRRSFLGYAAMSVPMLWAAKSGLGNYAGHKIEKIGVQLYTVRDQMKDDFEGTLARVAGIGYREVEFAGYYDRTPKQVRMVLDKNKLVAPSAHIIAKVVRDELDKNIEAAHAIGHKYLVCSYLFPEERKSLDDYKRLAELFNKAGEKCKKAGIQFAYHNHDFEFQKFDNEVPYDVLLTSTDSSLVKLEMDLYWMRKADQEPAKYFALYPGRFPLFHVKDMDRTPARGFTEVGRGQIDFKAIFAESAKAGVKHYFVEQDQCPGSPFDSIKTSYDYLKTLQF